MSQTPSINRDAPLEKLRTLLAALERDGRNEAARQACEAERKSVLNLFQRELSGLHTRLIGKITDFLAPYAGTRAEAERIARDLPAMRELESMEIRLRAHDSEIARCRTLISAWEQFSSEFSPQLNDEATDQ
jgi:hypothetical protein